MLLALKMKNVCGGSGKVREVAGGGWKEAFRILFWVIASWVYIY